MRDPSPAETAELTSGGTDSRFARVVTRSRRPLHPGTGPETGPGTATDAESAVGTATTTATGGRRWLARLAPPPLAYLLVRLLYARVTGVGVADFSEAAWGRWDSGNYADIAQHGYYWASCASQNRAVHGDICSPAAWYPAFPYLGRWLASLTGLGVGASLVVIAHAAFLGLLFVVWLGFFRGRLTVRNVLLLVLTATFPGAVYFLAAFPMSLLVLALTAQVACFVRGRWWLGAVFGALASLCYPIAIVVPLTSTIWVLIATVPGRQPDNGCGTAADQRSGSRSRWVDRLGPVDGKIIGRALGVGAVVASATVAVFALHHVVLGDWAASLHEQEKFGGTLYNPVLNWLHTVVKQNSWIQVTYPETARFIAAQTLFVTLLVAVAAAVVVFVRQDRTRHDVGLLVMVLGLWILPLSSNIETGLYRRVAPLVPAVYLLRRAPWPVTLALTIASTVLWLWMAPKFASGALI